MPSLNSLPDLSVLQGLIRKRDIDVFLVGGCLRDLFVGRQGRDLDFAVSKNAIALARAFAKKIRGTFVLLDEESGCGRVAKKRTDGLWTYDFADLRAKTLAGDLKKRDFTINTFALDFRTLGADEDFRDHILANVPARADMKARIIRMAGKAAFTDDPLRLLRAYSLTAQLGFRIEPVTKKAIRTQARMILKSSPERIREELFKVLETPRAAVVMKSMYRDGLLFVTIPELRVMEEVHQGGFHHLDVWQHSLETLVQLEQLLAECQDDADLTAYLNEKIAAGHSRRAVLKLAAILHDIGKPDTKKIEDGRTSFHGHEHVGRQVTRIVAKRLMLSTKERFALEDMVALHLRPGYLSNFKKPSEKMVFRFFRDAGEEAVAILLLCVADQRSTRGPLTTAYDVEHQEAICLPLVKKFFDKKKEKPFVRLIGGKDIIKVLKLAPGPAFKDILTAVEEAQHLGQITTKAEALALAKRSAESSVTPCQKEI